MEGDGSYKTMSGSGLSARVKAAIAFYGVYGLGFFVALNIVGIYGIGIMPLFPFQISNLEWSSIWLIQTIFDYYGCSFCIVGVIICTEASLGVGIGWALAICLGGCPFACLWALLRLQKCGTLQLSEGTGSAADSVPLGGKAYAAMGVYAVYGAGFAVLLIVTYINQPLFPFQLGELSWANWWLATTVVDYYGCCAVYAGMILSTEEIGPGVGWVLGVALVGTPASCVYVILRLSKYSTLGMVSEDEFRPAALG